MSNELPIHFAFDDAQTNIYTKWLDSGAFGAIPDDREDRYVIMMPLPNVTGALHMGHAMDNIMQDLLIRFNRMRGKNTLWMPGCDHAGIATQAVVETRIFELEGKNRHDIGRDELVSRIWNWKDEYQKRIIDQQKQMGCSCDWDLHRFTMDRVCARAVREAFFRMFKDGLIYRGNRLVNWDCQLQTAVSDDEIYREAVDGNFWHIKYPVIDPVDGDPEFVAVATTRPETMLGDTAVAVHPDPEASLKATIGKLEEKIESSSPKDRKALELELERLRERVSSQLSGLMHLTEMATSGRLVRLPLTEREIPLILDEWAKPELGSGCVKVTPAHDSNDYEVWSRHQNEIGIINLLNPDGTYNDNAGVYSGLDRDAVRARVLEDLESEELILEVEDREIELGFSDRSKTPIEPYASKQWFVRMGDIPGGIECGIGTPNRFNTPGLAQAAIDAAGDGWRSPTGRNLTFFPDSDRYRGTFVSWLGEKRDWCISRQLWWGHRIPIWRGSYRSQTSDEIQHLVTEHHDRLWAWITDDSGEVRDLANGLATERPDDDLSLLVCIRSEEDQEEIEPALLDLGLERDPDVLDTWFSSGLWPFSTLGWPDPGTADVENGRPLSASGGGTDYLEYFYPGSCLVTGRDIITLWVAKMTMFGIYLLGDVPFTDCFIHANIQDGKGERMSKSKGNGIDPVDILAEYGTDAMRYVICDMQTGMQDIKLPVQAISPFTDKRVDLATAKHGTSVFTYIDPDTGGEFDVLGTVDGLPRARVTSERFELGKSFCTKLWNASRFAFLNLDKHEFTPLGLAELASEDRWILSRLSKTVETVTNEILSYNPSSALAAAREFFWGEFCDWYLEIIKPRMATGNTDLAARSVLAYCLDRVLRLFHPFVPYITETLWAQLNSQAPSRGVESEIESKELLIVSKWPAPEGNHIDESKEAEFALVKEFVRSVRDLRARYDIPLSKPINAKVRARGLVEDRIKSYGTLISHLVNITSLEIGEEIEKPPLSATTVIGDSEVFLEGLVDQDKERSKLEKQKANLASVIGRIESKLNNSGFVSKAPAKVVEGERVKLAESQRELEKVLGSLADLSG